MSSMKYFVFSDIHSCLDKLKLALMEAGYDECNDNHKLLFLGDAFDKGTEHYETYLFLKENIKNGKLLWTLGNHECFLLSSLAKNTASKFTKSTIRNIALGFDDKAVNYSDTECIQVLKNNKVDQFILDNTIRYYETNNYVFTHGIIPINNDNTYDINWRSKEEKDWYKFINTGFKKLIDNNIRIPNKTLVCGHMYTGNMHKSSLPYYTNGIIAIDGNGYKPKGKLNVIVIED